jgi:hypothetical protein
MTTVMMTATITSIRVKAFRRNDGRTWPFSGKPGGLVENNIISL